MQISASPWELAKPSVVRSSATDVKGTDRDGKSMEGTDGLGKRVKIFRSLKCLIPHQFRHAVDLKYYSVQASLR